MAGSIILAAIPSIAKTVARGVSRPLIHATLMAAMAEPMLLLGRDSDHLIYLEKVLCPTVDFP